MQIKVRNLWKSYNGLKVLKGLSLDILQGETLVILGRSGVGKSVLLRQIIGIEVPDQGYVEVDGVNLSTIEGQKERHSIERNMGMLFQGSALFDSMNVGDNTAFYLHEHVDPITGKMVPEKEIKERVAHALAMVGMEKTEKKMPSELSGGMRKRAALARLIVYRPKLLLYDEPTTGLDPITAGYINELINKTKEELNATSVVVTHDVKSAIEIGDRLAFHSDGKIAHIAPKDQFFKIDDPILKEFFTNSLINPELLTNCNKKGSDLHD